MVTNTETKTETETTLRERKLKLKLKSLVTSTSFCSNLRSGQIICFSIVSAHVLTLRSQASKRI